MKNLITIILITLSLTAFTCQDDSTITHPSHTVCCRAIYLDTLNPETNEIEFDDYETENIYCKNDSENLIVRQIINCQ